MDSYIVIHVKSRDEKVKILTFLGAETDSEFKVTTDLKEYVTEKCNIKVPDNVAIKHPATDLGQEKAVEIITSKDNDIAPTSGYNLDAIHGQRSDIADLPSPQPLPPSASQQQLSDMGTDVPYRYRMVQPKEEVVDANGQEGRDRSLMRMDDVVPKQEVLNDVDPIMDTEENEGEDIGSGMGRGAIANHDTDNQPIVKNISSSRKSGRRTKRPNYSMDEGIEEEEEEYVPRTKKSKEITSKSTEKDMTKHKCQKCGLKKDRYQRKLEHVLKHARMTKFECMVDNCGYKTAYKYVITDHMKRKHAKLPNKHREAEFTPEEAAKFEATMNECFPGKKEDDGDKCTICQQSIGGNSSNSATFKTTHALHHVDFMLYKCKEDACHFKGKSEASMHNHRQVHGDNATGDFAIIQLTRKQELEIEKIVKKCFPGLGNHQNADDEEESDD